MDLIGRKEALENGLNYYYTGNMCKNGHYSKRVVSNGTCYSCILIRNKTYLKNNEEKVNSYKKEWYLTNKDKIAKYGKSYREENKDKIKAKNKAYQERAKKRHKWIKLNTRYKISREEYEILLNKNNSKCHICNEEETSKTSSGKVRELSVDHCHTTNQIRGLLCNSCNHALGLLKDSVSNLKNAITYLEN